MTCASHVQAQGRGFPGQLGIFSDAHLEGLSRLAAAMKRAGTVAIVQLHHAGMRSPRELIGTQPVVPVGRCRNGRAGADARRSRATERGLHRCGSARRARGLRRCRTARRPRLRALPVPERRDESPQRPVRRHAREPLPAAVRHRGRRPGDAAAAISPSACVSRPNASACSSPRSVRVAQRLMREGSIDFLDMSLWDVFKEPQDEAFRGRSLLSYFTDLERGSVRLGAAGRIMSGADARRCLEAGPRLRHHRARRRPAPRFSRPGPGRSGVPGREPAGHGRVPGAGGAQPRVRPVHGQLEGLRRRRIARTAPAAQGLALGGGCAYPSRSQQARLIPPCRLPGRHRRSVHCRR